MTVAKTIALFSRRPEISREQFRDHYETVHAPLAARHVPFAKYVRSYLVASDEAGFDVLTEFWREPMSEAERDNLSPGRAALKADGERLIADRRFYASAEERLIAGAPRAIDTGPVRRYALLLNRPPDIAEAAFTTFVNNWALRLFSGNSLTRVTLDIVRPQNGGTFPADAIVSLWPNRRFEDGGLGPAPAVVALGGILALEVCETPKEELAG
jgi:hypothetical protein